MPGIDFARVKAENHILDYLYRSGWKENSRVGTEYRGPCPIHGSSCPERSRTFVVNAQAAEWYCHKCKLGGSVLDLAAYIHGTSIYIAALQVCGQLTNPVPFLETPKEVSANGQN